MTVQLKIHLVGHSLHFHFSRIFNRKISELYKKSGPKFLKQLKVPQILEENVLPFFAFTHVRKVIPKHQSSSIYARCAIYWSSQVAVCIKCFETSRKSVRTPLYEGFSKSKFTNFFADTSRNAAVKFRRGNVK